MKCGFNRVTYVKGNRVKYLTDVELRDVRPSVIKTATPCPGSIQVKISSEFYDDEDTSATIELKWLCTENHPTAGLFYGADDLEKYVNEQLNKDSRTLQWFGQKGWKPNEVP